MKRFADLYDEIDRTTSTNAKVAALVPYLREAPPADAAWALFFLTGRRLTRHIPTRLMHAWTIELTGLPEWLVEESYSIAGDFAEAIALLLDGRVNDQGSGIGDHHTTIPNRHRSPTRRRRDWRSGSSSGSCRCAGWTTQRDARTWSPGGRASTAANGFCSTSC